MDVNRMRALNDEVSTWKTRAENLMAEVKVAQRKAATAEAELERSNDRAARVAEAQVKAETLLKSSQAEVAQLRDLASQSTRSLQDQLKRSEGESNRLAASADNVSSQVDVLQRRLDAVLNEKASLESTTGEALASASKARDVARIAQASEQEMAKELENKSVQVAQLYVELDRVRNGKQASDAQFEALTSKLTAAHQATASEQAQAKTMASLAGDADQLASDMEQQLKTTRERADAAELAIEALKSQLALAHADAGAKFEAQRATTDALDSVNTQLEALQVEKGSVVAGRAVAEDAHGRLELRVKELQADLGQRDATIIEMTDVLDTLRSDLAQKSSALATALAQAENTEGALGSIKNKSAVEMSDMHLTLAGQSDVLDAAVAAKEAAELALKDATSTAENASRAALKAAQDVKAVEEELEETKAGLEAEADRAEALSQLLTDREAELSSLRQQLAKSEAVAMQAESLQDAASLDQQRLGDAAERHGLLSDDLAAVKDELTAKQTALDAAVGGIKDCERTIESLALDVKESEARVTALQKALEEAEDRIATYEQDKAGTQMNVGDARSAQRDAEIAAADAKQVAQEAAMEVQRVKEELEDTKLRLAAAEKTVVSLGDEADDVRMTTSSDLEWKRRAAELEAALAVSRAELVAVKTSADAERQRLTAVAAMREAEHRKTPIASPVKTPAAVVPVAAAAAVSAPVAVAAAVEDDDAEEDHESLAKGLVSGMFDKIIGSDE